MMKLLARIITRIPANAGTIALSLAAMALLPLSSLGQDASPTPSLRVVKVEGQISLHHELTVTCEGLKEWAQGKNNDPATLSLYLNGTQMKGLSPKIDQVNSNKVSFRLERVSDENKIDNRRAWDSLFSGRKGIGDTRFVRVTIGPEAGIPFFSDKTAPLLVIDPMWFWIWLVLSIFLLIAIWILARNSNLLRDSGDPPPDGARKPYSLARWQMAFWFFFIVVAYLFIFIVTGATDTITASVLGLMGISAGTGLAAVAVENSKRTQAKTQLDEMKAQKAKLEEEQAAKGDNFPSESRERLAEMSKSIDKQKKIFDPNKSESFLHDLLSDADGISFHRLQIAVWTVVLGIIFCDSVYYVLSMPTFSDTLLGLMGISGGTYIGFKIPEKLS